MLVVSTTVALILRLRVEGGGISAVLWPTALLAAGLASARWPVRAIVSLLFLLPVTPYVRYETWLGKSLPAVFSAAVLVGVALSHASTWSRLLRDRRGRLATPILTFAAILAMSIVLVLLHRSPFFLGLTGAAWVQGVFARDWVTLLPQSTLPILRGGWFLLGPLAGLALLSLLTPERGTVGGRISRDGVIGALLLTSLLNLGVACGQVYIPGFPLETLRGPVSGLFHNPNGLSLLMTLAAPVALAVSLRPHRIGWLRPVAFVTLVLVILMFVPIRQRSAHLGVITGITCTLATLGLLLARRDRKGFRQVMTLTTAIVVLLVFGVASAFERTGQWQQVRSAVRDAPLSAVWLGIGQRQELNQMAFYMVGDRPLGGYGIGGFDAALPAYYERYGPSVRLYDYHSALNHPLHVAVDLGIVGLGANLWLLGAFVLPPIRKLFARAYSVESAADVDPISVGCVAAGGAAFLLSIWVGEWMYDAPLSVAAFMLLALAAPSPEMRTDATPTVAVWAILALPLVHGVLFVLGV